MASEADLILALSFLTEGAAAVVPRNLRRPVFTSDRFCRATDRLCERARPWTAGRGIQGIGIGGKRRRGQETGELALRVYVERKMPRARLPYPVPRTVTIPEVGRVPTDVVEIGRLRLETFRARVRPARPGSSLSHHEVAVGTFGCLVRKRGADSALYILSASHVLADAGLARPGDPILQPAPDDGGRAATDTLAVLAEFVPFDFSPGYPNRVDAAIARVRFRRSVRPELRELGVKPAGVRSTLRRGTRIQKVGRTTDHTTGIVEDVHYRARLPFRSSASNRRARRRAGLRDLVLCSRFSAPGDSGALVLDGQRRAVGLHLAGSPSTSVFCRIDHVFEALDVELI